MLQDDHQKSQDELTQLASKKSVTLPTTLDDNSQADLKKLSTLSGAEFDKEYTNMMVSGHQDAIALFKLESSDANDADIRQWAGSMLSTLQKHLGMATDCQKKCSNAM
jgi:putative membrane protein